MEPALLCFQGLAHVQFVRSVVSNNTDRSASTYGTVYISNALSADVSNCTFESNTGGRVGALTTNSTSLIINNSVFTNNEAMMDRGSRAGALYIAYSPSFTVKNSTFTHNKANSGGALRPSDSVGTITDSVFAGNEAFDGKGGAVYMRSSLNNTSTLERCTFVNNTAVGSGGGLYVALSYELDTFDTLNSTYPRMRLS